jgi:hypothetical protein
VEDFSLKDSPRFSALEKGWAPLPCTVSGFCSQILNESISSSLVSILLIPHPETLPNGPGHTFLHNIMEHTLMLKKFNPKETKNPKWQLIASCKKFKAFMDSVPTSLFVPPIYQLIIITQLITHVRG